MSEEVPRKVAQAAPFQRFTVRLVDGHFVRVPKSDLPSVERGVDPSATSNQTEIRDLFRLVNGRFVRVTKLDPADSPRVNDTSLPRPAAPPPSQGCRIQFATCQGRRNLLKHRHP